jgi:hypothetical protein
MVRLCSDFTYAIVITCLEDVTVLIVQGALIDYVSHLHNYINLLLVFVD